MGLFGISSAVFKCHHNKSATLNVFFMLGISVGAWPKMACCARCIPLIPMQELPLPLLGRRRLQHLLQACAALHWPLVAKTYGSEQAPMPPATARCRLQTKLPKRL